MNFREIDLGLPRSLSTDVADTYNLITFLGKNIMNCMKIQSTIRDEIVICDFTK
jgi:hypothetical protein